MRSQATLILAPYLGKVLDAAALNAIVSQFPKDGAPIDLSQFAPRTCGSVVFAAERIIDVLPDLHRMHLAHWSETEGYRRGDTMDPDYERGIALEQDGSLIQFTARCEGKLVGNIRMYLACSMHTKLPAATEDTVFLAPEHRVGRTAVRFVQYMEDCLFQLRGETDVTMDDKIANPAGGKLLELLGYELIAHRRFKKLKGKNHVRADSRYE